MLHFQLVALLLSCPAALAFFCLYLRSPSVPLTVSALPRLPALEQAQIVSIQSLAPSEAQSSLPFSTVIGISIGAFFFVSLVSLGGLAAVGKIRKQARYRGFLAAFRTAKAGQPASSSFIPLKLYKHYVAEEVLGKGAFGCVIRARTVKGGQPVALKLIVPEQGSFSERESRQLAREASVLELFTSSKCDHAVNLVGVESVSIKAELAYFVMELLDGDNLETIVYDPGRGPFSDMECIKAARNVLSALKVRANGCDSVLIPNCYLIVCADYALRGPGSP